MHALLMTVLLGIGATAVMDLWGLARKPLLGMARPDYGLAGRWIGYMPQGRFHHRSISSAAPLRLEKLIGWTAHYVTGIGFAAVLVYFHGLSWLQHPTAGPALLVGLGSVAAPFLLMQPGMGAGIAASRTPCPACARTQTVITHAAFAVGLYAAGWAINLLYALT
ncbi:MAG: DUF2938 domain-containing protein [Comamonas sp.]|nr:DUF2938 domain-containing protein [Comamonas sp.]